MSRMTSIENIKSFIFAGKAIFTIKSATSGKHWTFKIIQGRDKAEDTYFAYILIPNDEYVGIGYIKDKSKYYTASKAKHMTTQAEIMKHLFMYLERGYLNSNFEFYHEGKCGRCGRPLTDPTSIERGLGPTCASRV